MIQRQSVSKNYIFQLTYQVLIFVFPLILSPYLTRTLQESSLGVYSYVNSIAYYFVVAANLGIAVHGKRLISRFADHESALRKSFWSLFLLHTAISIVAIIAYAIFVLVIVDNDVSLYLIEGIYVASALFDITWLFYGLENFSSVVIRNTILKVCEFVAILLFVQQPQDLWKYTLISALSVFMGQLIMLPIAAKIVKPIRFGWDDITPHIKPLLVFSISVIAVTLYTVFDKTLLGIMTTKENVAFYEYSNKIISIPKTFISVTGTVLFPRACKLAFDGEVEKQRDYMNISLFVVAFIGFGSIFGLLAIADQFARIYLGESFAICGSIIKMMAPLILIIGLGDVIRQQCMIPNGMDKQFNFCIMCNAIINLVFSVILIPFMGIYGAVIGTLAAEMFGMTYQIVLCKKYIKQADVLKVTGALLCVGLIMFMALCVLTKLIGQSAIGLLIKICIGAGIYCICTLIYIFAFNKPIWNLIVKKSNGNF